MITISHNNNPYRPLVKALTDVVFLTLPVFKEVCLHILEKHAGEHMRYHFAFDRDMLHDILPTLSQESSLLISLGTSVIVKQHELDCFTLAYNFHPAPPEYRGSQPYHFALYEKATHYGATCHEMDLYIDHGPIIYVDRFEILPRHTSMDLLHHSLHQLFAMMENLLEILLQEQCIPLPQGQAWGHRMMTEKRLQSLCQLSSTMTKEVFDQRYQSFQNGVEAKNLVLHFHGHTFRYEGPVDSDVVDLFGNVGVGVDYETTDDAFLQKVG